MNTRRVAESRISCCISAALLSTLNACSINEWNSSRFPRQVVSHPEGKRRCCVESCRGTVIPATKIVQVDRRHYPLPYCPESPTKDTLPWWGIVGFIPIGGKKTACLPVSRREGFSFHPRELTRFLQRVRFQFSRTQTPLSSWRARARARALSQHFWTKRCFLRVLAVVFEL